MALWCHGTVLWYHGTTVAWYYGTMVPWYHGAMVLWYYGTRDPGLSGFCFRSDRICFRGPNFRTGCPGIWQAREKHKLAIPAAGPGLTQLCPDFVFAERENKILTGPTLAGNRPVGLGL